MANETPGRRGAATAAQAGRLARPVLAAALTLSCAGAGAEEASPVAAATAAGPVEGAGPQGDVLTARRLLQLMEEVRTGPGKSRSGAPVTTTTDTWKLRGDLTLPLDSRWSLVLRADVPYLAKDKYTAANPDGRFLYGLGDADVEATLVDVIDGRWRAGGGVRLIAPTGDPAITSSLWRIMPIAAVRAALPEIASGAYVEPLVRYEVSLDGDWGKRFVSNLQFGPALNLPLPGRWFVTLYPSPEIRWNFGSPVTGQTGRLFLPFDARVGRRFSDAFSASLEVSVPIVRQYPVYDFMSALRVNLTF